MSIEYPDGCQHGWIEDALAVADHLGINRFYTVGTSTGGANGLAVAALVHGAELRIVDGLGHFSIEDQIVPALLDLRTHES